MHCKVTMTIYAEVKSTTNAQHERKIYTLKRSTSRWARCLHKLQSVHPHWLPL